MNYEEIIIYSLVQGITEFLPISSSAHLLFLENIFTWQINGRTSAIAAHLGTLIAVILYLKKDFINLNINIYRFYNNKLIINLVVATIPIILVGLLIFKNLDSELLNLRVTAMASILGGIILYWADSIKKSNNKKLENLSILQAFIIGIFQIFALIPGTSRAGAVITGARFMKLNRTEATKMGLFTGIPTISAAVVLEFSWLINNYKNMDLFLLIIITLLSCAFSIIAIKLLIIWVRNKSFLPFVIYRVLLGIIILFYISS